MKYAELIRKQDAELADLRQQLAEARAEVTREVDRTHQHACKVIALENNLAAQAAELATLRAENQELKGRIGNALL